MKSEVSKNARLQSYAGGAILVLLCLALASSWKPCLMDDAYISFRYALRLGHEHSLAWNRGEPPLEGYSNPLWVFILSPFAAAGMLLETPAFWLGCFFLIGSVILVYSICSGASESRLLGFSAALGMLLSPGVMQSSLMGLETSLYGFLVLLSCFMYSQPSPSRVSRWCRVLALCLLGITRFEGFALALAIPVAGALSSGLPRLRVMVLQETCTAAAFVVACFLARRLVFGEYLPMSVYAKSTGIFLLTSRDFAGFCSCYLMPSLRYLWGMCNTGILICMTAIAVGALSRRSHSRVLLTYPVAILFTLAACILNGGDWMPGFRLLTPVCGCILVGGISAIADTGLLRNHKCLLVAFSAALLLIPLQALDTRCFGRVSFDKTQRHPWDSAGRWMNRTFHGDDLCLVEEIGRIGYFGPDLRIVDFQGLVNEKIAKMHSRGSFFGKRDDEAMLPLCPALIQSNNARTMQFARDFFLRTGKADYDSLTVPRWGRIYLLIRKDVVNRAEFVLPTGDSVLVDMRKAALNPPITPASR